MGDTFPDTEAPRSAVVKVGGTGGLPRSVGVKADCEPEVADGLTEGEFEPGKVMGRFLIGMSDLGHRKCGRHADPDG